MKKVLVLSCALALAGLSNVALAAEGQGFVRAEIGNSDIEVDSVSDDDTSFALRGGYYFTDNLGVEAFYTNIYDKSVMGSSIELSGYGLGAVGKMNFGPDNTGFFVSGRAGVLFADTEASDAFGSASDSSNDLYFGIGGGYDFSDTFGVSVNYDFQETEFYGTSIDIETLSVGGEFRF